MDIIIVVNVFLYLKIKKKDSMKSEDNKSCYIFNESLSLEF
jgi:hypothetical protein